MPEVNWPSSVEME